MKFCMQCGHELGASRTCTSCGTIAPVEPLPAPPLPPAGVRYPLFADEVDSVSVTTSGHVLTAPVEEPLAPPPTEATARRLPAGPDLPPRRGAPAAVWLVLGLFVLGALVLGAWLLLHGGPSSGDRHGRLTSAADAPGAPARSAGDAGDGDAAAATASAPVTRSPGVDTAGNKTSYDASNMVDGDPTTAWEMPGDGSGKELTFRLAGSTHLTEVGLVNGYAKSGEQGGRKVDWYAGNRRVLAVEWLFDDGSSVKQDLRKTTNMQTAHVDVTTGTVRLRLVEVSAPGKGPAARDMTAVSEVRLDGTAG
jgi:hypothetical protein